MHELPITQSLLQLVLEHATRAGGGRVMQVHLVVGELSRVVDDSVQFYWDILSRETMAAGARLCFRHLPLRFAWRTCQHEFEPKNERFVCPSCRATQLRVVAGDEFRLESLDVDDACESASAGNTPKPETSGHHASSVAGPEQGAADL